MSRPASYSQPREALSLQPRAEPDPRPHKCQLCFKGFRVPEELRRHLNNKRPCAPPQHRAPTDSRPRCRYCSRAFAQTSNVARHQRESCPLAPAAVPGITEDAARAAVRAQADRIAALEAEVARLTCELRRAKTMSARPAPAQTLDPYQAPCSSRDPPAVEDAPTLVLGDIITLSRMLDGEVLP